MTKRHISDRKQRKSKKYLEKHAELRIELAMDRIAAQVDRAARHHAESQAWHRTGGA